MLAQEVDRKTIAILLAMVIPGAGHIYYSPLKRRKGFIISVLFVIATFISGQFIGNFLGLEFLPILLIWGIQLKAVLGFNEVQVVHS